MSLEPVEPQNRCATFGWLRSFAPVLVAAVAFLGLAADGSARPQTTNPTGYFTVHVTVTNTGVRMIPSHAPRGQTGIFLVSNLASGKRVFSLGSKALHKQGTGFVITLAPNAQKRLLRYLDYRGRLRYWVTSGGKTKASGVFVVT